MRRGEPTMGNITSDKGGVIVSPTSPTVNHPHGIKGYVGSNVLMVRNPIECPIDK